MAKREPSISFAQMEKTLGYTVADSTFSYDTADRFYSDLSPVSKNTYERTRRELEEYLKFKHYDDRTSSSEATLPESGLSQVGLAPSSGSLHKLTRSQRISSCGDSIVLERKSRIGVYSFTADVHYGIEFHLPLQLTENEASATISVAKVLKSQMMYFYRLMLI